MPGGDFRVLGIQRLTGTGDGRGRRCGERESKHECNALAVKLRLALAASRWPDRVLFYTYGLFRLPSHLE